MKSKHKPLIPMELIQDILYVQKEVKSLLRNKKICFSIMIKLIRSTQGRLNYLRSHNDNNRYDNSIVAGELRLNILKDIHKMHLKKYESYNDNIEMTLDI